MSRLIPAGTTVSLIRHSDGGLQANLVYHLDLDGGIFARTVPITLQPAEGQPGSQQWTKDMLIQLIEHL